MEKQNECMKKKKKWNETVENDVGYERKKNIEDWEKENNMNEKNKRR